MALPSQPALLRAKRSLQRKFEDRDWFRGVGIMPMGDGYALRLNVSPDVGNAKDEIPDTYYNIAVQVVKTAGYELRTDR